MLSWLIAKRTFVFPFCKEVACVRSVLLEQEMVAMSSTGTCFAPLPRMKKDNS